MSDAIDLESMDRIFSLISNANAVADALEKLMNDHPAEQYSIPTENLVAIASLLKLNAQLAKNLFEENQSINDNLVKIMRNLVAPPKED